MPKTPGRISVAQVQTVTHFLYFIDGRAQTHEGQVCDLFKVS